jgi:hypothetical protein
MTSGEITGVIVGKGAFPASAVHASTKSGVAALSVAKQSEHPRAFEVVGNLIKQLADVNQQLLSLHQQKQKIDAPTKGSEPKSTNNTAIFVGSTAELNKMLKNMTTGD